MSTIGRPLAAHADHLDGWRGLAIVLLLAGHFFPVPGLNLGVVGVNLFFVLSGLLMAGLLFEKEERLPRFYRRRIARILPAHVVYLAVVGTVALASGTFSAREFFGALFFFTNYLPPEAGPAQGLMPFGHIWSLSVEEHSYIVLSLVAIGVRRGYLQAGKGVLALVFSVACCALYYQWLNPPKLQYLHWLRTEVGAYGLLLTALWVAGGRLWPSQLSSPWLAPALLLAGVMLHWWSVPPVVQRLLGVGCFAAAICSLHMNRGWFAELLSWAPLRQLGLWSFSIYLWQQPFYRWLHAGDPRSAWLPLALGLTCGLASFYLVEQPARRFLNANWGAPQGAPQLGAA